MSASAQFVQYVVELLAPMGAIRAGRFFGGAGLSHNGTQFAMVMGNRLYFAVDDTTRGHYENAGMQAFSYLTKKGRVQVRKYFEVPTDLLDDPPALQQWAHAALSTTTRQRQG